MAEITQVNGRTVIDYMARDYGSFLQSMRALIPEKMPQWTDYESEADFGNVLLQLFAHMGDILSYYQDRVANESYLGTARERRSVIQHLRLIGYTLATASPASATLTLSVPTATTDVVTIRSRRCVRHQGTERQTERAVRVHRGGGSENQLRHTPRRPADQQKGPGWDTGGGRQARQRRNARHLAGARLTSATSWRTTEPDLTLARVKGKP